MFKRLMLLSLVTCVALTNTWADAQVGQPDVHVGDIWKYRHIDGFTNETVWEYSQRVVIVNDHEIVTRLKHPNEKLTSLRYFTREWNGVDVEETKYDPFYPEYKFPMSIGANWKLSCSSSDIHGIAYSLFFNGKIVTLEKVTVPAGTFDAYRIENDIETRGAGINTLVIKSHIITWYSPEVQKFIRRESTTSSDGKVRKNSIDELVEYSLEDNSGRVNDI